MQFILYTRIIPSSSCLRVNMGCALVILFQVHSPTFPQKTGHFYGAISGSPTPKSVRSILALKLSVTTTARGVTFLRQWIGRSLKFLPCSKSDLQHDKLRKVFDCEIYPFIGKPFPREILVGD